jgi:hypothetical protein
MEDGVQSPPLMRLPSEVRVMIYNLLVDDNGHKTFPIRSGPAAIRKPHMQRRRTTYRALRRGLLLESQSTTYYLRSKVMFARKYSLRQSKDIRGGFSDSI